jgi:hypothetical protein
MEKEPKENMMGIQGNFLNSYPHLSSHSKQDHCTKELLLLYSLEALSLNL